MALDREQLIAAMVERWTASIKAALIRKEEENDRDSDS